MSLAVVYRIDVLTREEYFAIATDSLDYCRKNKGMEIYAWCIDLSGGKGGLETDVA